MRVGPRLAKASPRPKLEASSGRYDETMAAPLLDGAEPYSVDNGPSGVLVLHGFTGAPRSMRALALAFSDAGYSVELPLLPGHGTSPADLVGCAYADWLSAAEAALSRLAAEDGRKVVAGLSMGGMLALSLALAHGELAGVILINPMVAPPDAGFVEMLRRAVDGGTEMMPSIGADIARPGASSGGYDATPVRPLISILDETRLIAPRLSEITCRGLLFSSVNDHVVPGASSDLVEKEYGGPIERVVLERSFHVATLDFDAAEIEKRSLAFVEEVTSG